VLGPVKRGFSLAETVVALFVLASSVLVVVTLFDSSLREHRRAEKLARAVMLADRITDRIRAFARDPALFATGWGAYNGVTWSETDEPQFTIRTDCIPAGREIMSPCQSIEDMHAPAQRKLSSTLVPVRIRVSWEGGGPSREVTVVTEVAEPRRQAQTLVINRVGGPPDPVPPLGVVEYEAQLRDSGGAEIKDVTFSWEVVGVTGNATPAPSLSTRDGRRQAVKHHFYDPRTQTLIPRPGLCRVTARARYLGDVYEQTVPLNLQ
jgi:Tfp pilus assembly protein PilV